MQIQKEQGQRDWAGHSKLGQFYKKSVLKYIIFCQWYSDTIGMTSGFGAWRKSEKIGKILTNLFVDNFVQDYEIGD